MLAATSYVPQKEIVMRYAAVFISALALGAMPMVGCADLVGGAGGSGGAAGADGTAGMGGTGGSAGTGGAMTCDTAACLYCPPEAFDPDPLVAAWFPNGLLVSFQFLATPQADLVQGRTSTVVVDALAVGSDFPASVTLMILGASTLTYGVTSGGTGTADIPIPEQTLMGSDLVLDLGFGTIEVTADADAAEAVIKPTAALFYLVLTQPLSATITLDADDDRPCSVLGDGVTLPVGPS